jgi:predicted NAD/FAD-dependent oxidoreductase
VLAAYEGRLDVPLDGAFVEHPVLSWAARDSSKPGRPAGEAWVLHAAAEWSEAHLEDDPREVASELLSAFAAALDRELPPPTYAEAHRWRYALPDPPLQEPCLFDERASLGAGGDWCGGPRIEGAFLSGAALAEGVLACQS